MPNARPLPFLAPLLWAAAVLPACAAPEPAAEPSRAAAAPAESIAYVPAPAAQDPAPVPQDAAPVRRDSAPEALAVLPAREPTARDADLRARTAFLALGERGQREFLDFLDLELANLASFQLTLQRYVLGNQERDPALWPDLAAAPWFDPAVHAPAQPIPRRPLAPDARAAVRARERIYAGVPPRRLDSGWTYDYASRELRRLPGERDAVRVFENALLGMPPGWDLAEALVERSLDAGGTDDGVLRRGFEAFAHAYTDRTGNVHPGITLYDAHASGIEIEMPDVDCLGIVHHVLDDWTTWKAVVSDADQGPLYAKVGDLFKAVLRHRGLRANLARAYLCGSTELRDGYQNNLTNFHALWEALNSDPAVLAARLPGPDGWAAFLQGWDDELQAEPDKQRYLKGLRRRYTLDDNAQLVRQTVLRALEDFGAYERAGRR